MAVITCEFPIPEEHGITLRGAKLGGSRRVYIDDWGEHPVVGNVYVDQKGVSRWASGPAEGERVQASQSQWRQMERTVAVEESYQDTFRGEAQGTPLTGQAGAANIHSSPKEDPDYPVLYERDGWSIELWPTNTKGMHRYVLVHNGSVATLTNGYSTNFYDRPGFWGWLRFGRKNYARAYRVAMRNLRRAIKADTKLVDPTLAIRKYAHEHNHRGEWAGGPAFDPRAQIITNNTDPYLAEAMAEVEADLEKGSPCTTTNESQSSEPMTRIPSRNLTMLQHALQELPSWPMGTLATLCPLGESQLIVIKSRSRGWGSTSGVVTRLYSPPSSVPTCGLTDMPLQTRLPPPSPSGSAKATAALFDLMVGISLTPPGGPRLAGMLGSGVDTSNPLARSLAQSGAVTIT